MVAVDTGRGRHGVVCVAAALRHPGRHLAAHGRVRPDAPGHGRPAPMQPGHDLLPGVPAARGTHARISLDEREEDSKEAAAAR